MSGLTKRFTLNAIGHGYAQIVTLAVQLLLVPFFLRYWGAERYADWLVLSGIPLTLTLLDLGVAQALASKATAQAAAGDREAATCSIQTAIVFTLWLCGGIGILTLSLSTVFDWSSVLGLETIGGGDAAIIIPLMGAYLCAGLLGGPLDAWFRTIDRAASGAFLLANRRMLDVLLSVSVLICGGEAKHLAMALAAGQWVSLLLLIWVVVRWSNWKIFGVSRASWAIFRSTVKPGVAYAGFPLAQVVTLQGTLQVLNQVASPAAVVAFTMARTLVRLMLQAGVVANSALKPEVARLSGCGQLSEAQDFVRRAGHLVVIGCLFLYACLIGVGPVVIELWSSGSVTVARTELVMLGFHAVANVAWFVPASSLIATNNHVRIATLYGVSSVVALGSWVALKNVSPPFVGASLVLLAPELVALAVVYVSDRQPLEVSA